MSINSILKRIEDEASAYSEQRLKDAEEERNKILDEANREAGRIKGHERLEADICSQVPEYWTTHIFTL